MNLLKRNVVINLICVFIFMSACTPAKVFTKDDNMRDNRQIYGQEEKYSYNDDYGTYNGESYNDNMVRPDQENFSRDERYSREEPLRQNERFQREGSRPDSHNEGYYEKGVASWYGREFHGSITASGERFDMNKMTAAHRKLPFGTKLLVRNLENGRSVKVAVNDRGPYRQGRILDLSYEAARRLDMISKGEANVGIIVLDKDEPENFSEREREFETRPVAGLSEDRGRQFDDFLERDSSNPWSNRESNLIIQAGAFYSRRNAERMKSQLEGIVNNQVIVVHEDDLYKVRIEGLKSRSEAESCRRRLMDRDISSFVIDERQ